MTQPRRFKAVSMLSREGRLMALGSEEVPDPEAKLRVARRLGISAAALASAAVTTAAAPSVAAAVASSSAGGIGLSSTALGKVTGSFIASTLAKSMVIGLGFGIASYAGTKAYTSRVSVNNSHLASVKTTEPKPAKREASNLGAAVAPPALEEPEPGIVGGRIPSPSSGSLGAGVPAIQASESSPSLAPVTAPVGRFDDVEAPVALPTSSPSSPNSLAVQGTAQDAKGATRAGAAPLDPRLAREVASLDLARAGASRGDAAGALREINRFERAYGYVALRKEAMLVNIDVLLSLGRRAEAAVIARQLLLLGAPAPQRARLEVLAHGRSQ